MIELVAAMTVMAIGVLAVFAMYHSSMTQLRRASTITTAAALADTEMENYRALEYESIGLASSDVGAADSTYTGQSGGAYLAISSPENPKQPASVRSDPTDARGKAFWSVSQTVSVGSSSSIACWAK